MSKIIANFALIPFFLIWFTPRDVVEWYSFVAIFAFISVFDAGLMSVGSRILRYESVRLSEFSLSDKDGRSQPLVFAKNLLWRLASIYFFLSIMGSFLVWLAVMSIVFLGKQGNWEAGYIYEISVLCTLAGVTLFCNFFVCLSNARGQYSRVQLLRGIFQWISFVCTLFVSNVSNDAFFSALCFFGLQFIGLVFVAVNFFSTKGDFFVLEAQELWITQTVVFDAVKKTFPGLFLIVGLQQILSVFVAENYESGDSLSFLLFMQILRALGTIARAPVYSQLPDLYNKAESFDFEVKRTLKIGIIFSNLFFLFGVVSVILVAPVLTSVFPELSVVRPDRVFFMLTLYFLLEFNGGCLVESLTVWRVVLWRRAALWTFCVFVVTFPPLIVFLDLFGIALSLVISYLFGFFPAIQKRVRCYFF